MRYEGSSAGKRAEALGEMVGGRPAEDKVVEVIVKLRTPLSCRPKALRCLSQLQVEVKVGGLHKVPMWDCVQVVLVATRVLEIRFGSWELRQVSGTSEVCLPSAGEKAWLPCC
ncbi:hypothetical protein L3X38_042193 [Prunus dulcis]|uniref:Uncharacterized protein n=1 Tax=Prunus dulcis TaxID=3755 RepID=A0AAD4UUH3_PRUDU|nr:hypothetical protein L3X38_042193 [Prunus dulcis]